MALSRSHHPCHCFSRTNFRAPLSPPTKSPSATTVEGVRGWTRSLRPPRDHAEKSLTVGRARPERNSQVRTMRSHVWACRATERHFRALRRSAAPQPMLPRPTRAHYLGYIMRVVGYGRGYAGGMFGGTPPRTLPLSPFAEKATSGHSKTAAGPMCGWIPESVPPSSSQTIKGCGHSHMTPTAPGLSSEWALWLWLASSSGPA